MGANIYKEHRVGARMDPRGTPQVTGATDETEFPLSTEKVLSHKKDLNQLRASPRMPTLCSRHKIRIVWSTVSNAALRSSKTRINESIDTRISFKYSRLRFLLKPD